MSPPITHKELEEIYYGYDFRRALISHIDSKKSKVESNRKELERRGVKNVSEIAKSEVYKISQLKELISSYKQKKVELLAEVEGNLPHTIKTIKNAIITHHSGGSLPDLFRILGNKLTCIFEFIEFGEIWAYFEVWQEQVVGKKRKPKLTLGQIALKHVYEGLQITEDNANKIVKEYGYNSGKKLSQKFSFYSSLANRKGKPSPCTKKSYKTKSN